MSKASRFGSAVAGGAMVWLLLDLATPPGPLADPGYREKPLLLWPLLPAALGVGTLAAGLALAGPWIWGRARQLPRAARRLGAALPLALPLAAAAVSLCSGPRIRTTALRPILVPGIPLVLWVALALALPRLLHLAERRRPAATAALLAVTGFAIVADRLILPGLYPVFRLTTVLTAAVGAAGAAAILPGERGRRGGVVLALLGVLSLGLLLGDALPGDRGIRNDLFRRAAPCTRRLFGLIDRLRSRPPEVAPEPTRFLRLRTPLAQDLLDAALPDRRRFSVVLLTIDTLRADHCGFLGATRPLTPRIDALAARSVVMDPAYSSYPSTVLSMASILSGIDPGRCAHLLGRSPEMDLPLQLLLSRHGRRTVAVTDFPSFLGADMDYARIGFDRRDDFGAADPIDGSIAVVDRAIEVLGGLPDDAPFFFWLHLFAPHAPYAAHAGIPSFGDDLDGRYSGDVAHADHELGRFLDALEARSDRDRVVVVLHADHGQELMEHGVEGHGSSLVEEQIRVPLLFRVPGISPRRAAGPFSTVDVVPTLLELLGIDDPGARSGTSRLRDLDPERFGPSEGPGEAFFQLRDRLLGRSRLDGLRRGSLKVIEDLETGLVEIYDLDSDPDESRNLALQDENLVASLRRSLSDRRSRLFVPADRPPSAATLVAEAERAFANSYWDEAESLLLEALDATDLEGPARARLLRLAGRHRLVRALPHLLAHEGHPDEAVRLALARALANFDDAESERTLVAMKGDPTAAVARAARFALALRGLEQPEAVDLDQLSGESLPRGGIVLESMGRPEFRGFAAQIVGTGAGSAAVQALALRTLARRRSPWLLPVIHSRARFSPWPDSRTSSLAHGAVDDAKVELALPLLRWILALGGPGEVERTRQRLRREGIEDVEPELLEDADIAARGGRVGAEPKERERLVARIDRSLAEGRPDWGLVQVNLFARLAEGTNPLELSGSLRRLADGLGAEWSDIASLWRRWAGILDDAARSEPRPHIRVLAADTEAIGGRWRALVEFRLDEEGGGVLGLSGDVFSGIAGSLVDRHGKPVAPPQQASLSLFGLRAGESTTLLFSVPIREGSAPPARLDLIPVLRGKPAGPPLLHSLPTK